LGQIYRQTDLDRDVTDVLLNLIMHTSRVSEAVRRNQAAAILEELSDVAAWLLSLVAKRQSVKDHPLDRIFYSDSSMTEIILGKYPAHCPACLERELTDEVFEGILTRPQLTEEEVRAAVERLSRVFAPGVPRPCLCLSCPTAEYRNEADPPEIKRNKRLVRRAYASANIGLISRTAGDVEDMFRRIYKTNAQNSSLEDIAFHLQEEVGEVAEALLRTYTYNRGNGQIVGTRKLYGERMEHVDEEIADVFSWMYSLIFKIQGLIANVDKWWEITISAATSGMLNWNAISLPAIIWVKYGDEQPKGPRNADRRFLRCGDCYQHVCQCKFLIARKEELVEEVLQWK